MAQTVLVGSTGFVGGNLMAAHTFDAAYHSTDVAEGFGCRNELVYNKTLGDWRTHNGVDLAAEAGEPVKAAALGRVSAVYQDAVWGWTVEVSDGSRVYRYQGLEAPAVQADDEVHAGDVLGKVGRVPAEAKLPSHLHFEVRQDGSCVDPETALG